MASDVRAVELLLDAMLVMAVVLIWIVGNIVTRSNGGTVDRANRVAQLYGYTICLVSVVTILFTVPSIISNLFQLSDPLQADESYHPVLTSFEGYKATWERAEGLNPPDEPKPARPAPTDEELQRSYEALRADRIARNQFEARRSLVSDSLMLILAIGLFAGHWRWLRRRAEMPMADA